MQYANETSAAFTQQAHSGPIALGELGVISEHAIATMDNMLSHAIAGGVCPSMPTCQHMYKFNVDIRTTSDTGRHTVIAYV